MENNSKNGNLALKTILYVNLFFLIA